MIWILRLRARFSEDLGAIEANYYYYYLTDKYRQCNITGDFNAKHAYFGCNKSNKAGDLLFDITEELDLTVLNDDTPTHIRSYRNTISDGEILDLALATRQMGPKIASCTVTGDVGSDHLPVHIELGSKEVEKAIQRSSHKLDKANWQKFRAELKSIELN